MFCFFRRGCFLCSETALFANLLVSKKSSPPRSDRANIDHIENMVALALALRASRVEIAHAQYYGWALKNRWALMPTEEQVTRAAATVEELRRKHHGEIVIDAVVPDYHARLPKPCVGGWGRRSLNGTPSGKVLPCHAAE